jgi:heme exporter protein D
VNVLDITPRQMFHKFRETGVYSLLATYFWLGVAITVLLAVQVVVR